MKLCFLTGSYPPAQRLGGIGSAVHRVASGLAAAGHHVHVIAHAADGERESTATFERVVVHRVCPARPYIMGLWRLEAMCGPALFRLRRSYRIHQRLQTLIDAGEVEAVIAPDYRADAWWFAMFGKRVPLVVSLHGPSFTANIFCGKDRMLAGRLEDLVERQLVRRADQIHAVSHSVAALVAQRFGISQARMQVIHNAVDIELFRPSANGATGPGRAPTILFVGRLEPRKGVEELVRAVPLVRRTHPNAAFTFVGGGHGSNASKPSMRQQLLALLGEQARGVSFTGAVSHGELVRYYQASTVCVFPSVVEPFGMVCLEAMACGKPVVATAGTGLAELITHRANGLLVPRRDPEALAGGIRELLDDEALRRHLGEEARETVVNQFTTDRILPAWEALLAGMVRKVRTADER